jgi:hypothetical protein
VKEMHSFSCFVRGPQCCGYEKDKKSRKTITQGMFRCFEEFAELIEFIFIFLRFEKKIRKK